MSIGILRINENGARKNGTMALVRSPSASSSLSLRTFCRRFESAESRCPPAESAAAPACTFGARSAIRSHTTRFTNLPAAHSRRPAGRGRVKLALGGPDLRKHLRQRPPLGRTPAAAASPAATCRGAWARVTLGRICASRLAEFAAGHSQSSTDIPLLASLSHQVVLSIAWPAGVYT